MAHVDDLTLVNSAQMAAADNIYLAKLGDADPDRRAALSELAGSDAAILRFINGDPWELR